MRLLLVIIPLLSLLAYGETQFNCTSDGHFKSFDYQRCDFPQKRDHFLFGNNKQNYWNQMLYLRTHSKYSKNQTIFLYVGGESGQGLEILEKDWCSYFAKRFDALCIYLQHRFYGYTKPDEIKKDNVHLLTTRQVLADVNYFIIESKKSKAIPEDAKIIAFGCSYSGTLVAWLRMMYPDQVHGAISKSAPLLAKSKLPEFGLAIKNTLDFIDPQCFPKIKEILDAYRKKCSGNHIHIGFCNHGSPEEIAYKIVNRLYRATLKDIYNAAKLCLKVQELDLDERLQNLPIFVDPEKGWMKTWMYQACNELGWFPTMPDLGLDFDYWTKRCRKILGQDWNEATLQRRIDMTNKQYGGLEPNLTNVVFTYGEHDYWANLGLSKSSIDSFDVVIVKDGRNCPKHGERHPATLYIENRLHQWTGFKR